MRSTSCQRSSDSASGRRIDLPALLIRMSMPPSSRSTSATSSSTASRSDRSHATRPRLAARGRDPLDDRVEQVLPAGDDDDGGAVAGRTSRAAASPMPDDAPVSRIRLPARSTFVAGRCISWSVSGGRMLASSRLLGQPAQRASCSLSKSRRHAGTAFRSSAGTRPVGVALLQERVAALDRLVGHVRQPRRLAGEHLLADQPVVDAG